MRAKTRRRGRIARGYGTGTRLAHLAGRTAAAAMRPPRRGVSGHLDVVVLQRERADALPRGLEERIEHGGRGDADRRLADATPGVVASGWHEDRLDLGHFGDAHRVVVIEVGLLDAAVFDGALLIEQRGQAVHERARHLPVDLGWVDGVGWIRC